MKIPGKELSEEEKANLSDPEFKTLIIGTLTEMIELGHKMNKEIKAIESEIRENIQGTNSEGNETSLKSTIWNKRKK